MAGITFPTLMQPGKLGRVHFLVRAFFLACSFAVCSHDMSLASAQGEKEKEQALVFLFIRTLILWNRVPLL